MTQPSNIQPKPAVVPRASENVIVFDMNNEYGEYNILTINVKDIELLNIHPIKQIRRIIPFRKDPKTGKTVKLKMSEMLALLEEVVDKFKNGMLIIEDPSRFMGKNMTQDIIGSICTNRHSSVDIVMHYQSISRPLPVIHENCNIYRFHHQADDVYRSKNKLEETTEAFKICQILVDNVYFSNNNPKHPCKRKFVFYYKDLNLVVGNFDEAEFRRALDSYMELNARQMKRWENKRDKETGQKVYKDYAQAYKAWQAELFKTYYGNEIVGREITEREAVFIVASGLKGVGKTRETMRHTFDDYCKIPRPPIFHK